MQVLNNVETGGVSKNCFLRSIASILCFKSQEPKKRKKKKEKHNTTQLTIFIMPLAIVEVRMATFHASGEVLQEPTSININVKWDMLDFFFFLLHVFFFYVIQ